MPSRVILFRGCTHAPGKFSLSSDGEKNRASSWVGLDKNVDRKNESRTKWKFVNISRIPMFFWT